MKIIDNATVSVDVNWDESIKNADVSGSPLTDLAYSSVYYKVNTGMVIIGAKITATKPTGGGHITTTIVIPAIVGNLTTVDFWATETDLTGNEGPSTSHILFPIDRLTPAAPLNFTVA